MKRCRACDVEKPLDEFPRSKNTRDGRNSYCKPCHNAKGAAWRSKNPDRVKEFAVNRYWSNRELEQQRVKKWRRENHDRTLEHAYTWRELNPQKFKAFQSRNRVTRRNAQIDGDLISPEELFERDGWMCWLCIKPIEPGAGSIDHVIPISLGGSHTWENVRAAHRQCNSRRGARDPEPLETSK